MAKDMDDLGVPPRPHDCGHPIYGQQWDPYSENAWMPRKDLANSYQIPADISEDLCCGHSICQKKLEKS